MNPGIADSPTEFAGIAFFALTAWACWRTGRTAGSTWRHLAVVHAMLMLEVFFRGRYHLHDLVDEVATAQGWYPQRASLQLVLIALVFMLAVIGWMFASRDRARGAATWLALSVTILAALLFAVEAVSLHDIDTVLYRPIGPFRAIGLAWIAAATVVALSALTAARS